MHTFKSHLIIICFFTFIPFTIVSCCQNADISKIKIKPLSPYSASPHYYNPTNVKSRSYIIKFYFIDGACKVTNKLTEKVDDYVLKSLQENSKDFNEFGSYQIELYRKTDKLNDNFREHIDGMLTNDAIDDYEDDLLYKYVWIDKKFQECTIYDNGKKINSHVSKKLE